MRQKNNSTPPPSEPYYTLLIVDNNAANVGVLYDYLRTNGFRILVARDGESAIERAKITHPDLILLDVLMPGIDGFETCRRLQSDATTNEIPVIFMTGLTDIEDKNKGFEAGGVDYLTKPLQLPEVKQRVMIHLRLRSLVRDLQDANKTLVQRASYLETSRQVGQQITALLDLDELLAEVVGLIQSKFGYFHVGIWLPDDSKKYLILHASVSQNTRSSAAEKISIETSQGIIANAYLSKEEYNSSNGDKITFNHQIAESPSIEYCELAIPLIVGIRVLGVLDVIVSRAGGIQAEESAVLQTLANQIAIAVRNAQLYKAEKQRLLEIQAVNRELETFSYSVSHDLRAPLRAIDGFCRLLEEDYIQFLPEDGKNIFVRIHNNTKRMGQLIDDLLGFSRLGRQPVVKSTVQAADLVTNTWDELFQEENDRRINFKMGEIEPCLADPSLLRQVWVNLLSNALKYTRLRDVTEIEVGSYPAKEGCGPVYFVRDNGVGFDMKYSENLFGVFKRLHTEREFEGSGVGLAIVARIIHRHGGEVWAEAEVDHGATFYFSLPE